MRHRSADAWEAAARTGALGRLGAFEDSRTLMAQLAREYETPSKL